MTNKFIDSLLTGDTRRMSHVFRYSSLPLTRQENVAEHSWYVAFYCLCIGKRLEKETTVKINFGKLLERAVVHDLDESLTGDFLRTVKYGIPGLKDLLDSASHKLVVRLSDDLQVSIIDAWQESKGFDLEGRILLLADLLCVASFLVEQLRQGNSHLKQTANEAARYLYDLSDAKRKNLHEADASRLLSIWAYDTADILTAPYEVTGYKLTSQEDYNDNNL